MHQIEERWEEIKETIRREYELTDISYKTWIKNLRFYDVRGDEVIIMIPMDQSHALTYINNKYKDFFRVVISELMDHMYDVSFVLEKDTDKLPSAESAPADPSVNARYEESHLIAKYKFDTFVVGNNNKLAHAACLAVAESPGEIYNPLYIYGGAGLGKTHLMHSIGHFVLEQNPDKKVLYVTSEDFTNDVIESIRGGNAAAMTKLRDKYRKVDVLMVDDIQFIIGKEQTQEEFFHTFNVLHSAGKAIILSSDKPPKDLDILDDRFRSRFEWGLQADIQPPDYETRMAILKRNAETCNKPVEEAIFQYIATNIRSNIRELEGAFNRVLAKARIDNQPEITLALAQDALKDILNPNRTDTITIDLILNTVADQYGVTADDITSKKRNAEFAIPRQVVMYLCRTLTDASLISIAHMLGKKDHSTVIHGVDKISDELKKDTELKSNIDVIKKKLCG